MNTLHRQSLYMYLLCTSNVIYFFYLHVTVELGEIMFILIIMICVLSNHNFIFLINNYLNKSCFYTE